LTRRSTTPFWTKLRPRCSAASTSNHRTRARRRAVMPSPPGGWSTSTTGATWSEPWMSSCLGGWSGCGGFERFTTSPEREARPALDPQADGLPGLRRGQGRDGVQAPTVEFELQPHSVLERDRPGHPALQRPRRIEHDVSRAGHQDIVTVIDTAVEAEEARHLHA